MINAFLTTWESDCLSLIAVAVRALGAENINFDVRCFVAIVANDFHPCRRNHIWLVSPLLRQASLLLDRCWDLTYLTDTVLSCHNQETVPMNIVSTPHLHADTLKCVVHWLVAVGAKLYFIVFMKVMSLIRDALVAGFAMEKVFLSTDLTYATESTMELTLCVVKVIDLANLAVVMTKRCLALLANLLWWLHERACIALYFLYELWVKLVWNPCKFFSPYSRIFLRSIFDVVIFNLSPIVILIRGIKTILFVLIAHIVTYSTRIERVTFFTLDSTLALVVPASFHFFYNHIISLSRIRAVLPSWWITKQAAICEASFSEASFLWLFIFFVHWLLLDYPIDIEWRQGKRWHSV